MPENDMTRLLEDGSDRLNAMLTPGLVHEMNNLLTGIYFNLETMREFFDSNHPACETLKEINQSMERIKELLCRTAQIHLNTIEHEVSYHDLETLVSSQLDLIRILFPKTFRISLNPPTRSLHVQVAELPFRVALLSAATIVKALTKTAKPEIVFSIHSTDSLPATLAPAEVAVSISLPDPVDSPATADASIDLTKTNGITLTAALSTMRSIGGDLRITQTNETQKTEVLLVLPEVEINL